MILQLITLLLTTSLTPVSYNLYRNFETQNKKISFAYNERKVSTVSEFINAFTSNANIVVTEDLDFTNYNDNIKNKNLTFSGTINGQCHEFKNLNVPLTNINNGMIENIVLTSSSITTIDSLSYATYGNIAKINNGTIDCIGVEKDYIFNQSTNSEETYFGSICGMNNENGSVNYSYYKGTLNFTGNSSEGGLTYLGNICGYSNGTLDYLYSTASNKININTENSSLTFGGISGTSSSIQNSLSKNELSITKLFDIETYQGKLEFGHISTKSNENNCYQIDTINTNDKFQDNDSVEQLEDISKLDKKIDYKSTKFCDNGVYNNETSLYEYQKEFYQISCGVKNNLAYDDTVNIKLPTNYSATLNGEIKEQNFTIDWSGFYNLVITYSKFEEYEKNLFFTIQASMTGIDNNGVYSFSNLPKATFTSCKAKLDGNEYVPDTIINEVGNHTIELIGLNGYSQTYFFTIKPDIIGVENNGVYNGSVTYSISGVSQYCLNGNIITNEENVIIVPGYHNITITGTNDYIEELHFTINPLIYDVLGQNIADLETRIYEGSTLFNISGGTAYIDGIQYKSNELYSTVGNHTLTIQGISNYKKDFNFVIKPEISLTYNSNNSNATYTCSDGETYLDGHLIDNQSVISVPGEHIIIIKGENGYVSEQNVVNISLYTYLVEKYDGVCEFTFSGGICKLDDEYISNDITGTESSKTIHITRIGNHTISVYGFDEKEIYYNKSFSITTNLNLIPNGIYTEPPIIPALDADLYLDGKKIETNIQKRVEDNGKHTLKVIGTNFEKEYTFEYKNPSNTSTIIYSCISILAIGLIISIIVIRKKESK